MATYHRIHYIIKPRLQWKYFFISLFVVIVTAIIVYYIFWLALVTSPGLENLSAGDWRALARAYNSGFIWVVIALALSAGIASIFLFHRLLGPIFVFERAIRMLMVGDLRANVHSRKRDELKGMAVDMQTMINNLRQAVRDDRDKAAEIANKIDKGDYSGAKEILRRITSWYTLD